MIYFRMLHPSCGNSHYTDADNDVAVVEKKSIDFFKNSHYNNRNTYFVRSIDCN